MTIITKSDMPLCKMSISELLSRITITDAKTDDERIRTFRLRHDVYATEKGWEEENADGTEKDVYDSRSAHALLELLMEDGSTKAVATLRFILPNKEPLPMQIIAREVIKQAPVDWPVHDNWEVTGESSRWLSHLTGGDIRLRNNRVRQAVTLALMRATIIMMKNYGLKYAVTMSSESIIRLLHERFGVGLYPIVPGPNSETDPMESGIAPIEDHGLRSPRWFSRKKIIEEATTKWPEVRDFIPKDED